MHVNIKLSTLLVVIVLFLSACGEKQYSNTINYNADADTAFNNGSHITAIPLDSQKIHTLTNLGMLWGFLKYHHHAINNGECNMDAELFRILPRVLAAKDFTAANTIMEQWVDHFGMPDTCRFCTLPDSARTTKFMPDYGYLFQPGNLPLSLIKKLEFIRDNRGDTSTAHYYICMDTMISLKPIRGNPIFRHEREYANCVYPDAGLRLLALYRYWNMIQYFYPDRHLIGEDWNKILTKFIPVFCNAQDTLGYQLACLQLIASIHDSHGGLEGDSAVEEMKGNFYSPFDADFVEGKLVVKGYTIDSASLVGIFRSSAIIEQDVKVLPGDIIDQIDGVAVSDLVAKYRPLTPASNDAAQLHYLAYPSGWILRGQARDVTLHILRNGNPFDVVVHRPTYWQTPKKNAWYPYGVTKDNIGYLNTEVTTYEDVGKVEKLFKNTKGIIVDMRSYPKIFPLTYEWLKPFKSPYNVLSFPSVYMPGRCEILDTSYNGVDTGMHYRGKLVVIVNSETASEPEYITMALATVPGAVVIGSTTGGADGNVSKIKLPGGLTTQISGIGVLYPDGSESQRVGVKIDKIVTPTIKGIKEQRDEQLEYAIRLINNN